MVEIVNDLEDEDKGWSLVRQKSSRGIIPTAYFAVIETVYYPLKPEKKYPPHTYKFHVHIKKLLNVASGKSDKGPISFTWSTKKKMGNTGLINLPHKGGDVEVNKFYDIVQTFKETNGVSKPKIFNIAVRYVRLCVFDSSLGIWREGYGIHCIESHYIKIVHGWCFGQGYPMFLV
jgi:hypothetical protein